MLVGFGQTTCLPLTPQCDRCKVNHLCPSAFKINPRHLKNTATTAATTTAEEKEKEAELLVNEMKEENKVIDQ